MRLAYQFQGQKVRVTRRRPINADTHIVDYGKAYKLQTWYTDEGQQPRIRRRCHDLHGQRSRSQAQVISLSGVVPMAHKTKTNSRSITSFKVKRSEVRVTSQLTQTHNMCHIFRTVRPKNFKVGMRMEEHQRQAP